MLEGATLGDAATTQWTWCHSRFGAVVLEGATLGDAATIEEWAFVAAWAFVACWD